MAEIGLFFLVLIWTTKEQLSQGKLGGRRGSSACTIISIFLAELASKSCKLLLPHHGRFCNKWHSAVAEAISEGINIYDRYVDKPGMLLDVHDVGEIYEKSQEKHMHISETNLFGYRLQLILFHTLWILILLSFPCKEGNILLLYSP